MAETKPTRWMWIALVTLYLALRLPALFSYAPTYDEPIYIGAGKYFAVTHETRAAAFLYHPPLAYHLTSLPLWLLDTPTPEWDAKGFGSQVGTAVLYESKTRAGATLWPQTILALSRLPILAVGLLGLLLCQRLGRRLGDVRAGWLAAAVWAVWPDVAAQSVQATTDLVAAVAALFLACTALRHFDMSEMKPKFSRGSLLALGAACGLAALSKHTLLLPIAIVAGASIVLRIRRARAGVEQPAGPVLRFLAAAIVAFGVLWAGYLFEVGTLAATSGAGHEHTAAIAHRLGLDTSTVDRFVESVSVPAPTYWRSVVDAFLDKARARSGATWFGYLNGNWDEHGFLAYFPIAVAVKTPIALLFVMAVGLAGWRAVRDRAGYAADLCLALFALPFAAAVASRLNIGVRHVLPALPFLAILGCAALAHWWDRSAAFGKTAVIVLAVAVGGEWAANGIDPLPFANVPSGGPNRLCRRLADSNLEVGQDLWNVENWCESHGVTAIHVLVHDPQGVYEREAAHRPYLMSREDMNPSAFVASVGRAAQTGDIPTTGLLALGESVLVRPLGWSRLLDVEPLARVGRTRIYRLAP